MVRLAEPGAIHVISPTKSLELVAKTLEPVREVTWLTRSKGRKKIVRLEDTLCVPEGGTLSSGLYRRRQRKRGCRR
jgi:hypothetical protein